VARLHEHQGKALLRQHGIVVPRGAAARSPDEAADVAERIGGRVVVKAQAWVTGRAATGGVAFADGPDEARDHAQRMLAMKFGNFPVTEVLVEESLDIRHELFVSISIDDAAQAPVLLLDSHGGSGIEDRAQAVARLPVDANASVNIQDVLRTLAGSPIDPSLHEAIADTIARAIKLARQYDARSLEINPLLVTGDGRIIAADCRITIDDYAVFRQPELGIEIARELDHPPTPLERIAYRVEQADHRGTFYFAQLATEPAPGSKGLIGFHGAGGGGSMMSMDAVTDAGFTLANFCDTSGNPSAAKVYRAARIILAQPGLVGYFGSGSGVASQEQFWSAYGLSKAFLEMSMAIPAVIRLGGNSEDRAVEILESACAHLPTTVEGYRKDDTPAKCAAQFATLVEAASAKPQAMSRRVPEFVGSADAYAFPLASGRVWIDHSRCDETVTAMVVQHAAGLLHEQDGKPVLAVSEDDAADKDSELIACEIECRREGSPVVFVDLAIAGLDDAPQARAAAAMSETV
jgi:succinyl-CoA synthetase beta subunit